MKTDSFKPYIADKTKLNEFTPRAMIVGILFGLFFAIANGYLALKIGTTISASIPAAILSMGLFKLFRKGTILENNIVQTVATIGEGLAAGVVFTIPALILLGERPSIGHIFLLSSLGGILGILFMIPMRRFLIVKEHKVLPFPEGTACAEILKAGDSTSGTAIFAAWGFICGGMYKVLSGALFLWKDTPSWILKHFQNASFTINVSPALLGVGYIVGSRITSYMFAGGAFAWWVLIPLIQMFGTGISPIYPSSFSIEQMSADEIWDQYIRYVGAGTLGIGGLFNLAKVFPLLHQTIKLSVQELFSGLSQGRNLPRTDQDISMKWLILGSLAIILCLWLFPGLPMNFLTIVLLVILGLFFVTLTSITVGMTGSTSNPVSGMIITTLLITCLTFSFLGWTDRIYLISAITMGCVSSCAICIAGTTAQDLKTGFLLGATPKWQQIAEILGTFLPALALGYVVYILNAAYSIGSTQMPAPQATLVAMVAEGVIHGDLPYPLIGAGAMIGGIMLLLRVPVLPFALGLYLPLSLSTATLLGGLVKLYVDQTTDVAEDHEKGTLLASGLIGGDACIGVVIALLTVFQILPTDSPSLLPDSVSLMSYLLLALFLGLCTVPLKKFLKKG